MGVEFLTKAKPTFEKHLDTKRIALATPDLLTQEPQALPRCLLAKVLRPGRLTEGEAIIVEKLGSLLVGSIGNTVVVRFESPPPDIVTAISKQGGCIRGTVTKMNKLSGTAEVAT